MQWVITIIEEFVIHVLSEFVITNYISLNNDFSGICYFNLNSLFQIFNLSHWTNSRRRDMAEILPILRKTLGIRMLIWNYEILRVDVKTNNDHHIEKCP